MHNKCALILKPNSIDVERYMGDTMSTFGMSASKVYANDSLGGNPAFWSVLPGGFAGTIEGLLSNDTTIKAAIQAKIASPNSAAARLKVVELITRATANCLGQKIVNQHLDPDSDTVSLLKALNPGTDAALNTIINDSANTALHDAFAQQSVTAIINTITRQTGRGLFQAAKEKVLATATDPMAVLNEIRKLIPV